MSDAEEMRRIGMIQADGEEYDPRNFAQELGLS